MGPAPGLPDAMSSMLDRAQDKFNSEGKNKYPLCEIGRVEMTLAEASDDTRTNIQGRLITNFFVEVLSWR